MKEGPLMKMVPRIELERKIEEGLHGIRLH